MPGYFVDTSALAKLFHPENGSERLEALAKEPGSRLIISQLSLVEIQSVFATKVRAGVIDRLAFNQLQGLFFAELAQGRFEVVLLARRHLAAAEVLVRTHSVDRGLRTLDAVQLSVALDLKRRGAASHLVASDKNLCAVAAIEGLGILDPTEQGSG